MNFNKILLKLCSILTILFVSCQVWAGPISGIIYPENGTGRFPLVASQSTPLFIGQEEEEGVLIAAKNLQKDIEMVAGKQPALEEVNQIPQKENIVLIGTIGKSILIDQLIKSGKLNVSEIAGKWETFVIETISEPFPGVEEALVIAGSDKRGSIFGIYELSKQIGVSPWNWWADVPVRKSEALYVQKGRYTLGTPEVKYRGIFINDEAPKSLDP